MDINQLSDDESEENIQVDFSKIIDYKIEFFSGCDDDMKCSYPYQHAYHKKYGF